MKLDLNAVQRRYGTMIWAAVNRYLRDADNCVRDRVRDAIFDKLGKGNLRKGDERAVRSLICKTARSVCLDWLRKEKTHYLDWLGTKKVKDLIAPRQPRKNPRGRPPIGRCHENRRSPRPKFYQIESILADRGLNDIKNIRLFCAWCEDLSIKEIAGRFKLSPMQVKGRLEYVRKKIRSSLSEAAKQPLI